jgi:RNA polymerase sigma-70 factor (ECF subfamily)
MTHRRQEQAMEAARTAELFEQHRDHLLGVAYRMLGAMSEAEDAVQETYLRLARVDPATLRDVRGWLTTAIARICLDELGSARVRRESYVGPWLPEPMVGGQLSPRAGVGPEERVTLDESISMAMLVLLESLTPAERTAFVLHDVLGFAHAELATVLGRAEPACRQLVSRARSRVRQRSPRFSADPGEHATVVRAFLDACRHGDVEQLLQVLDPRVVLRSDGGGQVLGVARRPVEGAGQVARLLLALTDRWSSARISLRPVNGSTGLLVQDQDHVIGVIGFACSRAAITEIFFVLNPDKLRHVAATSH